MRKKDRALIALMHTHGYRLVRQNRHAIWRHSRTHHQIVTSLTTSDRRALLNIRAFLRRKDVS